MLDETQITGQTKGSDQFRILESDSYDPTHLTRVLDGEILGFKVQNFVSDKDCHTIYDNFENFAGRYQRGADAPAIYAGTYHYGKDLSQYFADSEQANATLPKLFTNAANPVAKIRETLTDHLQKRSQHFRSAQWNGQDACQFVMRAWTDMGTFSLKPHDDEAQCNDSKQSGFEIQDAIAENPLCAVNICLRNGPGGLLRMWNIRPDDLTRKRLGLETTGSPYPPEMLADIAHIDIKIAPGDLYAFDGRYVHAVTQLEDVAGQANASRATLAFLLAHKDRFETIQWS
ncbi:MAG: hypothetical protein ABJ370_20215 [Paracoccaceae bacterium]